MRAIVRVLAMLPLVAICSGCATGAATGEKSMTVMTYNIHHGEGTDGKLDLERIAGIIRAAKADVVALQEVDDGTQRTGGVAQAAELGRLTGMHHVFGKAMDYLGGGYGQAILSRWPILNHEVHRLPQRPNREPRIMVVARIGRPGGEIDFASVHLDHQLEEVRLEQAAEINRVLNPAGAKRPTIVAGDFNAGPESGTMTLLMGKWLDTAGAEAGPTIPAGKPRRRIDYILAAPKGSWEPAESEVLEEAVASDHRPVVARVGVR